MPINGFHARISLIEIIIFSLVVLLVGFINIPENFYDIIFFPIVFLILLRVIFLLSSNEMTIGNDILSKDRLLVGLVYYSALTLVLIITIFLSGSHFDLPEWLSDKESLLFLAIHTLLQEIIFRAYFLNRLKKLTQRKVQNAIFAGMIFALAHLTLPNIATILPFILLIGISWSFLYQKFPNIIFAWASHFLVNVSINLL